MSKETRPQIVKRCARSRRNTRRVAVTITLVMSLLAVGVSLARWQTAWRAAKLPVVTTATTAAVQQQMPITPRAPSKEYIYAGNRLIATEEPATTPGEPSSGTTNTPEGPYLNLGDPVGTSGSTVNLTQEGASDWAHYGLNSVTDVNRKMTGGNQISNLTIFQSGPHTPAQMTGNSVTYKWSDGTPTLGPPGGSTEYGVFISGQGNGFQITAPADKTPRTLKVYVGVWLARGLLDVSLSDGSATARSDISVYNDGSTYSQDGGATNKVYTINYKAASAGQRLTVKYTFHSAPYEGYGNITFQAATLITQSTTSGGSTGTTTSSGKLLGMAEAPSGGVDLTYLGTLDWVHWGLNSSTDLNRKANVTPQISNFTVVPPQGQAPNSPSQFGDDRVPFSWADGTPTPRADTTNGVFLNGLGQSFQFTVPADTTERTLKVWVGVWCAQGRFEARLSDNSAPVYTDGSINNAWDTSKGVYTLTYKAASAGQTLTVRYSMEADYWSPYGNITLQAATLSAGMPTGGSITGTMAINTAWVDLTQEGTSDWGHWGLNSPTDYNHKSTGGSQISTYSLVPPPAGASQSSVSQFGNDFSYHWSDGTPTPAADTTNGVFINGDNGNGFQFTVPASRSPRVLKVYVGGWWARGKFEARLSDNSAQPYFDTSLDNYDSRTGCYTLSYKAASDGQTLTIRYTIQDNHFHPWGNITLQAVTLQDATIPQHSLSLNGAGAYLEVPNSESLNITGAVTVEAAIKMNAAGETRAIIERYNNYGANTADGGYVLRLVDGKLGFATVKNGAVYSSVLADEMVSAGVWHHVAGVYDPVKAELRVYVDGVLYKRETQDVMPPGAGTGSLHIGAKADDQTITFNGLIDEVRVSAAALYDANFNVIGLHELPQGTNTRGYWKFNGQQANDASGNGNNGTLMRGATYSTVVP